MKSDMERMKDKKMKTLYHQNLEMKDYVKAGTLYSARKTWQVRSYMLDVAGNYKNHILEVSGVQPGRDRRPRTSSRLRRLS